MTEKKRATQSSIYLLAETSTHICPSLVQGHEYGGCWPGYPSFEYCPPLLSHDSLPDCDEWEAFFSTEELRLEVPELEVGVGG